MSLLVTLATVKSRLSIVDATQDPLLTLGIHAACEAIESWCNRRFDYQAAAQYHFTTDLQIIVPDRLPILSITSFHTKETDAAGWVAVPTPDYNILGGIIHFADTWPSEYPPDIRMTYSAGYVLPGSVPGPGQQPLPPSVELACLETVAAWHRTKDVQGFITSSESPGAYLRPDTKLTLLPQVQSWLTPYRLFRFPARMHVIDIKPK